MAKKKVTLSENELRNIIAESVLSVMNEIDAKTYLIVHNATNKAKQENPKGNYIHTVNSKKGETNDSIIAHSINLEPRATDSMIRPYKDIKFMFYHKNLRQNVGITIFQLEQLLELTIEKAVLKGDIIFNNQKMNGSIIINMINKNTIYNHNSSKKRYSLEIDNRFVKQWNDLILTLQEASQKLGKLYTI